MSLTKEQLDDLCGGAPAWAPACPIYPCERQVGPYYSRGLALDAMGEHLRCQHDLTWNASTAEAARACRDQAEQRNRAQQRESSAQRAMRA